MKKFFALLVTAIMIATGANAQTAKDLARQQNELNNILRKSLDAKPTKDAKKQAKEFTKQGWTIAAGDKTIEKQLTESQLLGEELMVDDSGAPTKRFLQHTGQSTAGSYNAAYASARSNAMVEIASMIETEIAGAMQGKLDNAQLNSENATSVDKYNQRIKALVHQSLTNSIPVLAIHRVLPNKNYQVQVRIAFDKKEVAARLKRALQKELEMEGDELNELVDGILSNSI